MNKNQDLKAIPYQDILDARNELTKLQSWQKSLVYLDEFFDKNITKNKKELQMRYYSCAQLYQIFAADLEEIVTHTETILTHMIQREKCK
ncbi:hypothetical protein ACYSNW_12715 [Enterococcus sp. LJL99]